MTFRITCRKGSLTIFDKVERKYFRLHAERWKFTNRVHTFKYPIDETFSGLCKSLSYGPFLTFIRRESDYEPIEEVVPGQKFFLEKGKYIIEINAHIKVYAFVESPLNVKADSQNIEIDFLGEREVIFGVRSFHRRPSVTITTTKNLRDITKAISLLSSCMKTETSERSYPTLRGHPPLIEIGNTFSTPDDVEKPDSGVVVSAPEKLSYLYVASPLIYYTMADIEFGEPVIYSDSGFEHKLPPRFPQFEERVAQALQRIFFMDCLVRCAGVYLKELKELEAIEGLGLDIKELFSKSVSEQLPVYFDVPWERLEEYMLKWHLSYYVKPVVHKVKALPFILNELALVRLPRYTKISMRDVTRSALDDFFRGDIFQMIEEKRITKPLLGESQGHVWLSPQTPIGIAKADEVAFFNQLKYLDRKRERIEIALVLNDEKMLKEKKMVQRVYRERKDVPLKVRIFDFTSKEELADIFAKRFDLVHYIGHCDESGLLCSDGGLRTKELKENNTPLFFLNACNSYEEGADLLSTGSVGGVVTVQRIINEVALDIGYTFSRLLCSGFPLRKAVELAKMRSLYGQDYLILGNGEYSLVQEGSAIVQFYYEIEKKRDGFVLSVRTHSRSIGGCFLPYVKDNKQNYLLFNTPSFTLSYEELMDVMGSFSWPVIYEKRLYWTKDIVEKVFENKKEG